MAGTALLEVKQQRMDEDVFMEKRKEVLALWPTGKEVDLDEAVAYQKAQKVSERETAEDRKLDYCASIEDSWGISRAD